MLKPRRRTFFGLAVTMIAVLAGLGLFLEARWINHRADGPLTEYREFTIAPGMGLNQISSALEADGVIRDSLGFRVISRLKGLGDQIKAGNYRFPRQISPAQVLAMLHEGKTHLYSITIPEGLTSQQILARIRATKALSGSTPTRLAEASILPETYYFEKGTPRKKLFKIMRDKWQKVIQSLWDSRNENYPLSSLEDVLILASIVEKEAVHHSEMSAIAGVFFNRLRKDMKLQSDPTVIYALSSGLGKINRHLTRKDWKLAHNHNTYYRTGLPPTPIAHPSLDAVAATLNPKSSEYIFFVADGEGGHRFAVTLREHNANVAKLNALRKKIREKKKN